MKQHGSSYYVTPHTIVINDLVDFILTDIYSDDLGVSFQRRCLLSQYK